MNLKTKLNKLPSPVRRLIRQVTICANKESYKVYLVGGIVRDLILGRRNFDLDFAVEDDAVEFARILASRLGAGCRCHHSFRTATLFSKTYKMDLTTTRREIYRRFGALPSVEVSSLRDDLQRRDFTINAIAINLNKEDFGEVADYFSGVPDLKKGIIRILHKKSFMDDPTRLFRAIRFKQRFGFRFDSMTSRCFRQALSLNALGFVSEHRLRDELVLILNEKKPCKYIRALNESKVLEPFGIQHLNTRSFKLLKRIEETVLKFNRLLPVCVSGQEWIIYLMGLYRYVSSARLKQILLRFGFKKNVLICMLDSKKLSIIKKISHKINPSQVCRLIHPLSQKALVYFYAVTLSKVARKNIEDYLVKYSKVKVVPEGRRKSR